MYCTGKSIYVELLSKGRKCIWHVKLQAKQPQVYCTQIQFKSRKIPENHFKINKEMRSCLKECFQEEGSGQIIAVLL